MEILRLGDISKEQIAEVIELKNMGEQIDTRDTSNLRKYSILGALTLYLDQPVSGILVFAKTPAAAKDLNRQLTTSGFGKHYYALVVYTENQRK